MKVMDAREIEKRFGITEEQLGAWGKDASEGILHGNLAARWLSAGR